MGIMVLFLYTLRFWEFWKPIKDRKFFSWYSSPKTNYFYTLIFHMNSQVHLCFKTYSELSVLVLFTTSGMSLSYRCFQCRVLKSNPSVKLAQGTFSRRSPQVLQEEFVSISFVCPAPLSILPTLNLLFGPQAVY